MKSRPSNRFLAACFLCALSASLAQASTYYWDNNDTTAGFGTAGGTWAAPTISQWSTDTTGVAAPGASITTLSTNTTTDALNFGTATVGQGLGAGTITVGTVNSGNITFGSQSGAITLSGGAITFATGSTITTNNAANTIGSAITASGLNMGGTGILLLTNTNTLTGNISINAGTLAIGSSGALGTGTINLAGAAVVSTITANGSNQTVANAIFINGTNSTYGSTAAGYTGNLVIGGTVTTGGAAKNLTVLNTTEFSGVINDNGAGSGAKTKLGAGTLIFSGANTYAGATAINDGTLSINTIKNVSGGNSSLGAVTTAASGTIAIGSTTTTGTLLYTGTGNTTDRVINLAGTTGGATLDQSGTGLLKFTSAFTATGGGIKTLTLQGSTAGTGEISGAIINNSATNTTAVTKTGTGTWTLSGANTYTGNTSVTGGTLNLSNNLALQNSTLTTGGTGIMFDSSVGTHAFTFGGLSGSTGLSLLDNAGIPNAVALTVGGNNASTTYSGILSGTGSSLTKTGTGSLTLSSANTYTGGTTLNNGTLQWSNATSFGTSTLTLSGGTLKSTAAVTATNAITVTTGTTTVIDSSANAIYSGALSGGGTLNANGTASANIRFDGNVSGFTGTLAYVNTSNLANLHLAGSATDWSNAKWSFSGTTTAVQRGMYWTGAGSSTIKVGELSGTGGVIGSSNGTNVAFTLQVGALNTNSTFAGNLAGTNLLTKVGTGTLTLSGPNTYTGATTINTNGGTLQFAKTASLYNNTTASWTAANLRVASGGTLAFNVGGTGEFSTGNVTTLLTNLAASTSATNGMAAGSNLGFDTTNASGNTFTIGDVIANTTGTTGGARGLTKLGTNTLTLTNTNTYTGATTVSGGTLKVSGSIGGSAVTVNGTDTVLASGTTGTIGSSVTINNGAILAAGGQNAVGTATVTGATTFNTGSIFEWDIDVATDQSGETHDSLAVGGLLSGSDAVFKVLLDAGDSYATSFWDITRNWTATQLFGANNASVNLATLFSGANTFNPSPSQGSFAFTNNGGTNNQLTWSAVPEPTSALAGLLISAGLLRRRRKN